MRATWAAFAQLETTAIRATWNRAAALFDQHGALMRRIVDANAAGVFVHPALGAEIARVAYAYECARLDLEEHGVTVSRLVVEGGR